VKNKLTDILQLDVCKVNVEDKVSQVCDEKVREPHVVSMLLVVAAVCRHQFITGHRYCMN